MFGTVNRGLQYNHSLSDAHQLKERLQRIMSMAQYTNGDCAPTIDVEDVDDNAGGGAKLCHVRKRSVEIPLENLLSGIVYLSGGRDKRGGPILSIAMTPECDLDLLMDLTLDDFYDMLAYFTFVPSEDVRQRKFSVVALTDNIHDFFLRRIVIALNQFERKNKDVFHAVYFVSSIRAKDFDIISWAYTGEEEDRRNDCKENMEKPAGDSYEPLDHTAVLPVCIVSSVSELHQHIDEHQLTSDFGGSLTYDHQDWVRFRMQVEPFICDVVGVSKRLAEAIAPFTQEDVPDTLEDVEESLKSHHMQRRKTLETLHVEELASEGEKIKDRLQSSSKDHFKQNPDFNATLETIDVLLNRVENVRTRLDNLWENRHQKLEATLKQRKFEDEAHKIIDWFEQYAEEFFETHNEIGESLEIAQALTKELMDFEESTKLILSRTNKLLKSAKELKGSELVNDDVSVLASKIENHIKGFSTNMNTRKRRLTDAVRLHAIMDKSLCWCIAGVEFLSSYDLLNMDREEIVPEDIKKELDEFHKIYPPPTREEIQLMNEAVSSMEGHWGKDGFQFALNRILEIHDRFELYNRMLDEMMKGTASPQAEIINGTMSPELSDGSDKDSSGEKRDDENGLPQANGADRSNLLYPRSMSGPPGMLPRRGSGIQVSVMDIDKTAHQALTLLEETDVKARKLSRPAIHDDDHNSDGGTCSPSNPECISLMEFLDNLNTTSPDKANKHLKVEGQMRSRSQSAPDETDGSGTIKRSRSLRLTRNTLVRKNSPKSPKSPSPRPVTPNISGPSNVHFSDDERPVSLDAEDLPIEMEEQFEEDQDPFKNPEEMAKQTAYAKHRRRLMEELLQTEETYIQDLEHISTHYIPALEEASNAPKELLDKRDIIFGLIPYFLQFSRDIVLPRIKKCFRAPIKMGLVFLDYEEAFLNYSLYFKNKPLQDNIMINTGDAFFKTKQEAIQDVFPLNSYLIKPVQRMIKYKQFLEEMIKYSTKGKEQAEVQTGAKKEYFGKLKEALKMVDFVLRHGNDLLALDSLQGFDGDVKCLGKILRVGDLTLIDGFTRNTKHYRKAFLFENGILFAKTRKTTKVGPSGSDVYDYKNHYMTGELMLRENVPGHECRFALELTRRKDSVELQAESLEDKKEWVQEIWDLFFSHMLNLRESNLQSHGSSAISSIMTSTLKRGTPMTHTMRTHHTMRARAHTAATAHKPIENVFPRSNSRESVSSIGSATSLKDLADYIRTKRDSHMFMATPMSPGPISPRSSLAVSYSDKYKRMSGLSMASSYMSDTSSMISSASTISPSGSSTGLTEDVSGVDTLKGQSENSQQLKQKQFSLISEDSVDESLKMYSTPL